MKGRAWKSVTTGRPRNAVCEVNGIVENNSCKGNTVYKKKKKDEDENLELGVVLGFGCGVSLL